MKKSLFILVGMCSIVLSSCGRNREITYTIDFNSNGGTPIASQTVKKGDKIVEPNEPTKKGYNFNYWTYKGKEWSFIGYTVSENMTLDAYWSDPIAYNITYNLNGGTNDKSNPATYTIEDTLTFASPIKTGSSFVNWTNDGTPITGISKGSTGNITIDANWTINKYQVNVYTNDSNKGTVSGSGSFDYGTSVTVLASPKKGYSFDGWYSDSSHQTKKSDDASYTFTVEDHETNLYAKFIPIVYQITYVLNGGINHKDNPATYTVEDTITLLTPSKTYYTFTNWSKDGTPISIIDKGTTGDITLEAVWNINKYQVNVYTNDSNKGTVSGGGSYDFGSSVTITATPKNNCVFKGWYSDSEYKVIVSELNSYTLTVPSEAVSLYAKFWTQAEEETWNKEHGIIPVINDSKVTFGLYPTSHVSDAKLIEELVKIEPEDDEDYFYYDNEYYVKDTAHTYGDSYTFLDGSKVENDKTYFFKCEKITWNLVANDTSSYTLDCSSILYNHIYDISTYFYKQSDLRTWLKGDFYNNAFSIKNTNSYIVPTDLDDLQIKGETVFVGEYDDYMGTWYKSNSLRQKKPTDFAICNGAYISNESSYLRNGNYWTRTAYTKTLERFDLANAIGKDGDISDYIVSSGFISVSPSLRIKK